MADVGLKYFVHTQSSPSTLWSIYHALRSEPSLDIMVNYSGYLVKAFPLSVVHTDSDNVEVRWSTEQTGSVTLSSSFPLPAVEGPPPRVPTRTPMPPGSTPSYAVTFASIVDNGNSVTYLSNDPLLTEFLVGVQQFLTINAHVDIALSGVATQIGIYFDGVRAGAMVQNDAHNYYFDVNSVVIPSADTTLVITAFAEDSMGGMIATSSIAEVTLQWHEVYDFVIDITEALDTANATTYAAGDPQLSNLTIGVNVMELHATTNINLDPSKFQLGIYADGVRMDAMMGDGPLFNTYVVTPPASSATVIYTAKLEDLTGTLVPNTQYITSTVGEMTIGWNDPV